MSNVASSWKEKSFVCPHCGVLARQNKWGFDLEIKSQTLYAETQLTHAGIKITKCDSCGEACVWVKEQYVYPDRGNVPPANRDMPMEVKEDYEEAAKILGRSPRGSAALLRLGVQKLMIHLGQSGKNINDDIATLVADGLPQMVQQALDVVRVTGNNAVHPGQIDANDVGVAQQLFPLLNVIVEYQISLPARVREMYDALPGDARNAITRRDA